jgi:hypothetical protein
MTDEDLIDVIARDLRVMAIAGEDVPVLLQRVQQIARRDDCKLLSIQCFCKAFDRGIASISPIAGWQGFGGELSNEQINNLVLSVLEEYRQNSTIEN